MLQKNVIALNDDAIVGLLSATRLSAVLDLFESLPLFSDFWWHSSSTVPGMNHEQGSVSPEPQPRSRSLLGGPSVSLHTLGIILCRGRSGYDSVSYIISSSAASNRRAAGAEPG